MKEKLAAREGGKITVTEFLVRAFAMELKRSPNLNARLVDDEIPEKYLVKEEK